MSESRTRLRTTFEEVPELYDRARPTYPSVLFDDLEELARLAPEARVLEIGCGTGKATVALAERGYRLTCVELGAGLAAVARRNLKGFEHVEVVTADFETWSAPAGSFDAVTAFSAFHWLDPETAYARCAKGLRPGGSLAVAGTQHVLPEDGDPFFVEVQEDYAALVPEDDGRPPPRPDDVLAWAGEFYENGLFGDVAVRRYVWDLTYTAASYVDVLDTYSGHRALEPERRAELYRRIRRRIEARPGGTVCKTYLAILHVARRS
ncbi:MAG: trans-aconitate 2-methyltransferase [Gaiellaceae bacterium]